MALAISLGATTFIWQSFVSYRPELGFSGGVVDYKGPERREIRPPGGDSAYVFQYRPGAAFSLGFTFTNSGSRSVRILGFPHNAPYYVDHVGVWTGPEGDVSERSLGSPARLVAFEPFTLGAGKSRYIELRYRFTRCELEPIVSPSPAEFGGGSVLEAQTVRYRFSVFTRQMEFDLPAAVGLEGAHGECPPPR